MKKLLLLITVIFIFSSFDQKKVTWVAIGDSITYLNDHLSETGNRVSKGYLSGVTEQLPYMNYVNQGHNGWTAVRIAKQIEDIGLTKADLYTVFLGTNDWWGGLPLGRLSDYVENTGNKTVYGSFRIIINKIRSLNENASIILVTPMQRADFVYILNQKNNAWGSYKQKNGQSLFQFADAVKIIGNYEHLKVIDLYYKSNMSVKHLVRFKRLKDPQSGHYKNYSYPGFTAIAFNPETDEYPYPPEAMDVTYDGLHPSDKGNRIIAGMLIKAIKNDKVSGR